MDDDFKNIDKVMSEIVSDFEDIGNSATTIEQAIAAFAHCIQKRLGLYSAIVTRIDGERETFQAVFSSNEKYRDSVLEHPPTIQKISSSPALSNIVSSGQILIGTDMEQVDFSSPIFSVGFMESTASDIWLPVKKENKIIGIIKLGSRKILGYDNSDQSEMISLQFEQLLAKISQILEKKF